MKKSEHVLAAFKSGVSIIPCIGGAIASLIGDYIPTATQKTIQETIDLLGQQIEKIEDRIDVDNVNKDEFSELFKSCYLLIVRTHKKEKLKAIVSLITNILLKEGDQDKLSYRELDHYVRCIDNLSIGAIQVLINIYTTPNSAFVPTNNVFSRIPRIDFSELRTRIGEIEPALLMGLLEELNSLHLIHLTGTPPVRTEEYGNYPIERTALGDRFYKHLLKVYDNSTNV